MGDLIDGVEGFPKSLYKKIKLIEVKCNRMTSNNSSRSSKITKYYYVNCIKYTMKPIKKEN